MSQSIRAVYRQGQLCFIDPGYFTEGQVVHLRILSEEERLREALGTLLVQMPESPGEDMDEEALAQEIETGFDGQVPLSETIIAERHEGP